MYTFLPFQALLEGLEQCLYLKGGKLFDCYECGRSYWYNPNQMPRDGKGTKTNHTAGLTWSGFRPSDETCVYG